jgi:iron complex outermembrane receptor protein
MLGAMLAGSSASEKLQSRTRVSGQNLLGRWRRSLGSDSEVELQVYYDRTARDEPTFSETRNTFDVDLRHRFPLSRRHELNWGVGYRASADRIGAVETIIFTPASRTLALYSAFVQDAIEISADRLWLKVGTKLEHNDFSGVEVQPSVRLAWAPIATHTIWLAGSRAVRTPSRLEHDLSLTAGRDPATGRCRPRPGRGGPGVPPMSRVGTSNRPGRWS